MTKLTRFFSWSALTVLLLGMFVLTTPGTKTFGQTMPSTDSGMQLPSVDGPPEYFLQIDGISGESQDSRHKDAIEISSFSWGASNSSTAGAGGGGGSGKVNMQDFHFTMRVSKASPQLFLAVAKGKHIANAVLFVRKTGGEQQEYLKWTLSDVMVSSYQTGGMNGDVPIDQVSLNFAKIQVEYKPQMADGSLGQPVTAGWDLKQNKAF
jgi:type VI secretion system secreted protein Hcp